jgi:hypothetical protein
LAKSVLGASSDVRDAVQVFRGGEKGAASDPKQFKILPDLSTFKDQAEVAYAVLKRLGTISPNMSLSQWLFQIQKNLAEGGAQAAKTTELLNKLGANVGVSTLGEKIDQAMPGFKDLFAQLKVPVFDKTTGAVRSLTDAFGDFLDMFATKSPTEQARILTETMGRGFQDLLPIMRQGRAGMKDFLDAAKARGADTSAFDRENAALVEANKALVRLDGAINAVKRSFVRPFGDVFTPIINQIADAIAENQPAIKAFFSGIAEDAKVVALDLKGIFEGAAPTTDFGKAVVDGLNAITVAVEFVRQAFAALSPFLNTAADILNSVFSTDYSTRTYALAAAILYFTGILPAMVAGLKLVGEALLLISSNPIAFALAALALVGLTIYQNWEPIVALFNSVWEGMKSIGDYISSTFLGLLDSVASAWDKAKAAFGASTSAPGGVLPAPGLASGGMVSGPGGPTSDSVLARLSSGEFVMRSAAVQHWGPQFMAALNALRNPLAGYSLGGHVHRGHAIPRFADGGMVSASADGVTVNLHFPGGSFALRGDKGIVQGLTREARRASMLSAGRLPGVAVA